MEGRRGIITPTQTGDRAVRFLLVAGDYFVAMGLKVWGGNIIRRGLPRLTAVLRVFVICKIAAWVIRTSELCTTMMSQSMAIRGGLSSSCIDIGGWLEFGRPEKTRGAMRAKPGKRISSSAKGKRAAVFDKKYADQLYFRGIAKVAKSNLENTG